MVKKAVLPALAVLSAALVAGCAPAPVAGSPVAGSSAAGSSSAGSSSAGSSAAGPSASGSRATSTATARDSSRAAAKKPAPTPTSDAGDGLEGSDPGDGLEGSDGGDGGNWLGALKKCPFGEPEAEVQKLIRADVTGDGVKDALVARTCEASTSYLPSTVEIFDGAAGGERPRRIGILLEDVASTDRPGYRSLKVNGNRVFVKAHGLSEGGSPACPDLKLTYTYRFSGGEFTRIGRKTTKAGDCLPVG